MKNVLYTRALALATLVAGSALYGGLAKSVLPDSNILPTPYGFDVYPTGVWPGDVERIQWAVDHVDSGGKILLKATNIYGQRAAFEFGTDYSRAFQLPGRAYPEQDARGSSTVYVYHFPPGDPFSVTISGETDNKPTRQFPSGTPTTIIRNGGECFYLGWDGNSYRDDSDPNIPENLPEDILTGIPEVTFGVGTIAQDRSGLIHYENEPEPVGYLGDQVRYYRAFTNVSLRLQNVELAGPHHVGVQASAGTSLAVDNCYIHDVVEEGASLYLFCPVRMVGLAVAGLPVFYPPCILPRPLGGAPVLTGNFICQNCLFENLGYRQEIPIIGFDSANQPIYRSNEACGIASLFLCAGKQLLANNTIRNVGSFMNGFSSGIVLMDNYGPPDEPQSVEISGNTLVNIEQIGIYDFNALGIAFVGASISDNSFVRCPASPNNAWAVVDCQGKSRGCIRHNTISLDVSTTGVMLDGGCDGYVVADNQANFNAWIGFLVTGSSHDNLFIGNYVPCSTPGSATYFLDETTANNVVKGNSTDAVDLGANFLTGVTPMRGAPKVGPVMSEVAKRTMVAYQGLKLP